MEESTSETSGGGGGWGEGFNLTCACCLEPKLALWPQLSTAARLDFFSIFYYDVLRTFCLCFNLLQVIKSVSGDV